MTGKTEAHRPITWLKNEGAWHQMTLGDVEAVGRELLRLRAENLELKFYANLWMKLCDLVDGDRASVTFYGRVSTINSGLEVHDSGDLYDEMKIAIDAAKEQS